MSLARVWNLRVNLDLFNAAFAAFPSIEDKAEFVSGYSCGMNSGSLVDGRSVAFQQGFAIGKEMRIEAEAYREMKSVVGKTGGRPPKDAQNKPIGLPDGLPIGIPGGEPIGEPYPLTPILNKITTTTTTPPTVDQSKKLPKADKAKFAEHTSDVKDVVNDLTRDWREKDPCDGREIHISRAGFASRVKEILAKYPDVDGGILVRAGMAYCGEPRQRYKAPQYFFGPQGPWKDYIEDLITTTSKGE
jgi:hypothetical protein